MRAFLRDLPPNGLTVFFTFFLLAGVLIAIFLGEKFESGADPYRGAAIVQANS